MAERLVIISDMWGSKKGLWITSYLGYLQQYFNITFYDSQQLANLKLPVNTEENIHNAFMNGGIDTAVAHLLKKEKEPAIKVKKEKKRKGLTYNDQRELNLIEETMESEEEKLEALQQKAASDSMKLSPDQLNEIYSELQTQQDKVDQMYERWQELESLKAAE